MKKKYLILTITGIIVFVAILTNPNQDRHKEVVKNKINSYLQKSIKESNSDSQFKGATQVIGMLLGGTIIGGIVDELVSTDNYILFSTTKINLEGESKVIGIGAFGNVYVTRKLDEAISEDLLK